MKKRFSLYQILLGTDFVKSTESIINSHSKRSVWRCDGVCIYPVYFAGISFKHLAIYDSNTGSIIYFQIEGKGGIQGKKDFIETINKRYK